MTARVTSRQSQDSSDQLDIEAPLTHQCGVSRSVLRSSSNSHAHPPSESCACRTRFERWPPTASGASRVVFALVARATLDAVNLGSDRFCEKVRRVRLWVVGCIRVSASAHTTHRTDQGATSSKCLISQVERMATTARARQLQEHVDGTSTPTARARATRNERQRHGPRCPRRKGLFYERKRVIIVR